MKLNENLRDYLATFNFKSSVNDVILFLLGCRLELNYSIANDDFIKLIEQGVIAKDYISDKNTIKVLIPLFENDVGEKLLDISNIDFNVDEYRKLFRGIRLGSMGNKELCRQNIIRWLTNHTEYTFEDIITAAKYYINNTDPKYISKADNFVYADDAKGNEFSRLYSILEEMVDTQEQYKLV